MGLQHRTDSAQVTGLDVATVTHRLRVHAASIVLYHHLHVIRRFPHLNRHAPDGWLTSLLALHRVLDAVSHIKPDQATHRVRQDIQRPDVQLDVRPRHLQLDQLALVSRHILDEMLQADDRHPWGQ